MFISNVGIQDKKNCNIFWEVSKSGREYFIKKIVSGITVGAKKTTLKELKEKLGLDVSITSKRVRIGYID